MLVVWLNLSIIIIISSKNTQQNRDYWTRFKRIISSTFFNGRWYHIASQLQQPGENIIFVCRTCWKSLIKKGVPDICIASGFDLGDPAMAGLSDPTMAELSAYAKQEFFLGS